MRIWCIYHTADTHRRHEQHVIMFRRADKSEIMGNRTTRAPAFAGEGATQRQSCVALPHEDPKFSFTQQDLLFFRRDDKYGGEDACAVSGTVDANETTYGDAEKMAFAGVAQTDFNCTLGTTEQQIAVIVFGIVTIYNNSRSDWLPGTCLYIDTRSAAVNPLWSTDGAVSTADITRGHLYDNAASETRIKRQVPIVGPVAMQFALVRNVADILEAANTMQACRVGKSLERVERGRAGSVLVC